MSSATPSSGSASAAVQWLLGLWEYYKGYSHTPIHTASAAALTAFGLLVFVDRLFVVLAIAVYVCPPIVLYVLGSDLGTQPERRMADPASSDFATNSASDGGDGDSDSDSDSDDGDSDSDSDSDDGDSDSDSDSDGSDTDGSQ